MTWDSSWNTAVALAIVGVIVPLCQKGHRRAHEESKKRMKEGWLKWLVTHEFCKRTPRVSNDVRIVRKDAL